mgnify:CR=1 FL=1
MLAEASVMDETESSIDLKKSTSQDDAYEVISFTLC